MSNATDFPGGKHIKTTTTFLETLVIQLPNGMPNPGMFKRTFSNPQPGNVILPKEDNTAPLY